MGGSFGGGGGLGGIGSAPGWRPGSFSGGFKAPSIKPPVGVSPGNLPRIGSGPAGIRPSAGAFNNIGRGLPNMTRPPVNPMGGMQRPQGLAQPGIRPQQPIASPMAGQTGIRNPVIAPPTPIGASPVGGPLGRAAPAAVPKPLTSRIEPIPNPITPQQVMQNKTFQGFMGTQTKPIQSTITNNFKQAGSMVGPSSVPEVPVLPTGADQFSINNVVNSAKGIYGNTPQAQLAASQAVLESGLTGTPSKLAAQHNNLFGIKGRGTAGSTTLPTKEFIGGKNVGVNAGFAKNRTIADSFQQHKDLMGRPRYKEVMQAKDFSSAANAVHKAGYATDPNYVNKLQNVYDKHISQYFDGGTPNVTNKITDITPYIRSGAIMKGVNPKLADSMPSIIQDLRDLGYQPQIHNAMRSKKQAALNAKKGVGIRKSRHITGDALDLIDKRWGWDTKHLKNIKKFRRDLGKILKKHPHLKWGGDWTKGKYGAMGDWAHIQVR